MDTDVNPWLPIYRKNRVNSKINMGEIRGAQTKISMLALNEKWRNAVIDLVDLGIEQSLFFTLSDK